MKTLNQFLLENSCNFRCGIVLPYQKIPNNFCDISNVYNYAVPKDSVGNWNTASGSISFDENCAIMGALGESLERYAGAVCNFELKKYDELDKEKVLVSNEFSLFSDYQYNNDNFPFKKCSPQQQYYGKVYSLYNNETFYIPQELIGLGSKNDNPYIPSTSTGLAAHTNKYSALLAALLEVLERDALTVYWLNSLGGREIQLDDKYLKDVMEKNGEVFCFDITQDWNPFPVVIVCGYLLSENKKRISMGVACRESYEKAIEKAYLEWIQGCVFAGYYDENHPNLNLDNISDITSFDLHAVYYTKYPEKWHKCPLILKRKKYNYKEKNNNLDNASSETKLSFLLKKLNSVNIRLFYKDITTVDVRDVGLTVVRVISPDLSLIHGDENLLFLGGRTNDVKWRYSDLIPGDFPNKFPHPLG